MHAVADVHDTARSRSSLRRDGFGVVSVDQLEPFHRSANARDWTLPTTMQKLLDGQDTPASDPLPGPTPTGLQPEASATGTEAKHAANTSAHSTACRHRAEPLRVCHNNATTVPAPNI
jgi:hypothetical protein